MNHDGHLFNIPYLVHCLKVEASESRYFLAKDDDFQVDPLGEQIYSNSQLEINTCTHSVHTYHVSSLID